MKRRQRFEDITLVLIKSRVQIDENSCWIWVGSKTRAGAGKIKCYEFKSPLTVSRIVAYLCKNFDINSKLEVCHNCPNKDNPSCVNPDHLFIGTHFDNMRDAVNKKQWSKQRNTHCKNGHEYNEENTRIDGKNQGRPKRSCRICDRNRRGKEG